MTGLPTILNSTLVCNIYLHKSIIFWQIYGWSAKMMYPTNRNYIWDMCTVEDVAIGDAAVGVEVKLDFSMDYLSLL